MKNKAALIYFLFAGASFLPAWFIFDNAPEGWIKWISMTLLFIAGIYFSSKQSEHMGKKYNRIHERGFIYIDPLTKFQAFMDLYKGTFHDVTTDQELGTFTGQIHQSLELDKIDITFSLTFHSSDQFREAVTIK